MFDSNRRRITSAVFVTAGALLLTPAAARSQESQNPPASNVSSSPAELTTEVHELADTVRELQAQVQELRSQLSELGVKEPPKISAGAFAAKDARPASSQGAAPPDGTGNPYSVFSETGESVASSPASNTAASTVPADEPLGTRVAKLEDDEELIDAKLTDQYQTKVESGSKYRVRLSGMVLVNMFENRGTFDNADFPELVTEPSPYEAASTFAGTLRQSQIKLEAFGPDLWGAHTSANITVDFAGGFTPAPNGNLLPLPRFRTGTVHLDWTNTSIVAGQDFLFFSPLEPTSLSSVAVPPLSYSGNLWGWTPQIRIEHRINFSETSRLLLEAGILDSLSGDLPYTQYYLYPTWGEESGQPAYAGRVAWTHRVFGQSMTVGEGAYYGRQYWALDRHINGWAATTDLTMPLGPLFAFSGAFYRGSGVGGLGGAIGQDVLLSGSFTDPATEIEGINSMGGWAQLKFKPTSDFEINGAFGQDNPFASQIREYAATTPPIYGGDLLTRNRSAFVNFIYHPKSDVFISVEYLRLQSFDLDESYSGNHINLSLGYLF